ncbi:MAG: DUF2344 domain-containing protein [Clostridia bacterium]|nr:DUF2344 domain-containing protein [Clostridia bacterium]
MITERDMTEERSADSFPSLEEPRTVRLCFEKTGALQYISHLDLQRSFGRILARADLPVWYTQGFNPHPKLVFALPLPIGSESLCELADIKIDRDMPCAEILARLGRATSGGLRFTRCYLPDRKFASIDAARWEIAVDAGEDAAESFAADAAAILASSPLITKKRRKSGEKEIDLSAFIGGVSVSREGARVMIRADLAAGEAGSVNPENIMSVLRERTGIPGPGTPYSSLRLEMLSDGKRFE